MNNKSSQEKSVAIIGIAGIFPQAKNLQQYWQNILEGVDCITDIPPSRWKIEDYYDPNPETSDKTYCKKGGFMPDVQFNPLEFGMPPNILEVTDVAQLLSLLVAKQALEDAGYDQASSAIRQRTGVVLGIGGGQKLITPLTSRLQYPVWEKVLKSSGLSDEDTQKIIEKIKLAYIPWKENSFPGMLGNVIAGRIANRLDLGGMNCVVDAACASSLSALRMALSELTEHRADMMITGGVDTDNSIFMYMSFSKTPAFSKRGQIHPFSVDADGMLIGEGLGMLVLKRLEDAQKDSDRIYAVIKGIGASSDGKHKSIYAPRASGQAVALRRAYEDAEVDPKTVTLIEAHGTGTIAGDPTEFAGLNEVFSENNPHQQYIALGSVKSQIGHTKSAAGVASLIKVALSLHHKILPPTINVSQPNPKLRIEESPFYLNTQTRPWFPINNEIPRRAGVSSFGFGGTNFHIVLEEYQQEQDQPYRLHQIINSILISAPTSQQLLTQCQTILENLQSENDETYYHKLIKDCQNITIPRLSARVGFVAESLTEAIKLLEITIKYLGNNINQEDWELPQGIYYRKTGINIQGKVVALFAGQGSQYVEMGKELAINFPEMRQAFQLMDNTLIEDNLTPISSIVFPSPTFIQAEKEQQIITLNQTENAQPAIGAFNMGLYKILQQAGFQPDFLAGHSFGELTALWAAKVLTDEDYCFLVKSRGKAMASPLDNNNFDTGKMLAVKGNLPQIKSLIATENNVMIVNYNSFEQVVLAGASLAILKIKEKLEKSGLTTILLPVSAAFHTALVSHAQSIFAQAITKINFYSPEIPVYSNTTANLYPNQSENIQQILIDHLVHPVYFKDKIENIYQAGGRIFVEFGTKNILTKFVHNILADKPHLAVALNSREEKDNSQQSIGNKYFQQAIIKLRVFGLKLNNVDPYQLEQQLSINDKKKGLTVTLNGANYISEKTKNAFENALQDKYNISLLSQDSNNTLDGIDQSYQLIINQNRKQDTLTQSTFIISQEENTDFLKKNESLLINENDNLMKVKTEGNEHSLLPNEIQTKLSTQSTNLSPSKLDNIRKPMQESNINEQLKIQSFERIMMRFYDHQASMLNVHEQYLKSQLESSQHFFQLMQQQYALLDSNTGVELVYKNKLIKQPLQQSINNESLIQNARLIDNENGIEQKSITDNISNINSEFYRENLTTVQTESIEEFSISENLSSTESELETESENQNITLVSLEHLSQSLLEVVSDKTGYPTEMLELEMDMETDLGIDSIKRVEILGAMQGLYPNMPPVNPEELAELRTLKEIVNSMSNKLKESEKKTLMT